MKTTTKSDRFTTQAAAELYGIDSWGNGYLTIGEQGNLTVTPSRDPAQAIDVRRVIAALERQGIGTPVLLRFPQLLAAQIDELAGAFSSAIREFEYQGRFRPVYPMKVNQQRQTVQGLLDGGARHGLGLEVGSRPELLAAAAVDSSPDALIICNGYKDAEYLSAAAMASRLGKRVVVVVEKPFELDAARGARRRAERRCR